MRLIIIGFLSAGWMSAAEEWQRPPGWTATKGGEGDQVIEVTTLNTSLAPAP